MATIVVGIVQFVATFGTHNSICLKFNTYVTTRIFLTGSIFLVDSFGRRPLLLASSLIMSASTGAVGAYFILDPDYRLELALDWLPLAAVVFFMVGYSVGFASVPYVLMGELLPARYRNALGSAATAVNLINTFLVVKVYVEASTSSLPTMNTSLHIL